ncbi:hypothetical protein ACFU9Y_00985 [Streptomyces sp. NPDC057621]|uniref:hypothetical protein n=1 Tax=Streptomyces sp. NPDC057621 TaxID=3346186 RepID=UPI0036BD83B4
MAVLAVVAMAAIGMSKSGVGTDGGGNAPRPLTTVEYPIRFESATTKVERPQPAVSYPVPWVSGGIR